MNKVKVKTLYKNKEQLIRVLAVKEGKALIIDCRKCTMPIWITSDEFSTYKESSEQDIFACLEEKLMFDDSEMNEVSKRKMHERYTLIAGVIPFLTDEEMRSRAVSHIAEESGVSKQTIRKYLCLYLVYQEVKVLAPQVKENTESKKLTKDEKNMRWALNKFFYNKNHNSLKTAYAMLLKEKYCDESGKLKLKYPSFYQFRYFYRKTRKLETYYISRNGLKNYQRNNRPLLGDGVQQYAPLPGVGMLDATICDIYLINEANQLVGRPILTVCVDAFSGICMGYTLTWEGGVYSLRNLMMNVISDKKEYCDDYGIEIDKNDWNCSVMPGKLVTDKGAEYKSENFEQLSDLGITIVNLPAYRPELKGPVEKFFDLIQNSYKKYLKGKGVIEPDFQVRGAHDYRKDASLTMEQFEQVILHCIIYYNSQRVLENFPYTEEMINENVKPYASDIWNWGINQTGANLLEIEKQKLVLTLLPRTFGKFTRTGLIVNKMRYHNQNYKEEYLQGKEILVAYSPDNVSNVWVVENGAYICFELIESRYSEKVLDEVLRMKQTQKSIIQAQQKQKLQAEIELASHIEAIVGTKQMGDYSKTDIKNIRQTRTKERSRKHKNLTMREVQLNG